MPLRLHPPGTRKGNRCYVARGRIEGRQYEISTGATDARVARQIADRFEREAREQLARERDSAAQIECLETFGDVGRAWIEARRPGRNDRRYLTRLIEDPILAPLAIDHVTQAHIHDAAARLLPTARNETRNRQVITPAAAILHWAAESDLCRYRRIRRLREAQPQSRRPPPGAAAALIEAAKDPAQRRFLIVLWAQGWRITETLGLTWERHIRLADQEYDLWVGKAGRWKAIPMHPLALAAMAEVPLAERTGRVWPWSDRHAVYRWLDPLLLACGLAEITGYREVKGGRSGVQRRPIIRRHVTPHMLRHDWASAVNAAGATEADILATGSWTDAKSIARYTAVNREQARATLARRGDFPQAAPDLGGELGGEGSKTRNIKG